MSVRQFFSMWIRRFRTMVRYRLLLLTSVPIIMTLLVLIALTMYWTVRYTWQSALMNVRADLAVAHHSMVLLQQEQRMRLIALTRSYDFQYFLREHPEQLTYWAREQFQKNELDFVKVHPASAIGEFSKSSRQQLLAGKEQTFFEVLDADALSALHPDLPAKAQIPLLQENTVMTKGLVSRSLIPVFDARKQLKWIVDGGILLNNSTQLVDQMRDLVYAANTLPEGSIGTVTLFLGDIRVSTNVPLDSLERNGRAVGTRVSQDVHDAVLKKGETWVDRAFVYDDWYISAYEPLRDHQGHAIGMLYTGYLEWPMMRIYLTNIVELGIGILIILLISGVIVYRGARDLFRPIERMHKVVIANKLGLDKRIGSLNLTPQHELQILGQQFDTMLDQLRQRNEAIRRASLELEDKVRERTQSLQEKTKELEQHIHLLNQARSRLVSSEKLAALGELTAGIAHEINNPTAVILGNVELLQYELGDDVNRVEEELTAIHEQIDRIRNITRSLLQYSRQGGVQDEVTWQHLNPIVEESLTLVRSGTKKMAVRIDSQLDAHCCVEVNRHQLLQVLVNLQMNGVHAMDDEGQLLVKTEDWVNEHGETLGAVVHITDHGCGISPDVLPRIFDPFFTTRRSGTGLGLSVSQGIISGIGGEISVVSVPGEGSTFSVYLPEKAICSNRTLLALENL